MFYIRTADRLTRTSVWLDKMEGGIERLHQIIVDDALGVTADLERDLQYLVDTYECEWAGVLRDPERRAQFKQYSETAARTPQIPSFRPRLIPSDQTSLLVPRQSSDLAHRLDS